jgi:4'-phosphopantetheinyl transferase
MPELERTPPPARPDGAPTDLVGLGRIGPDRDEVHLWWGRTDAVEDLDAGARWLSDEERRQAERFRWERDRRAFLFRRSFLRAVLARAAGRAPERLDFGRGPFGKPFLRGAGAELGFSLSRAREVVLLAVARVEVGVDVEHGAHLPADPEGLSGLARRVLTPREHAAFARIPSAARSGALLALWARKEALLKALGTGLARAPDTLHVGLGPRGAAQGRFRTRDLAAPPGFAASLAVAGRARLRVFGAADQAALFTIVACTLT